MKYAISRPLFWYMCGVVFSFGRFVRRSPCSRAPAGSQTADVLLSSKQFLICNQARRALIDVRTLKNGNEGHATGATLFELARIQNGEFPDVEKRQTAVCILSVGKSLRTSSRIAAKCRVTECSRRWSVTAWQQAGGGVE
jgi:hypothetical protein